MAKEQPRNLKYRATGNCPACNGRMWWEEQSGAMAPRWRCVCGYSVFLFAQSAKVDFDLLNSMARSMANG